MSPTIENPDLTATLINDVDVEIPEDLGSWTTGEKQPNHFRDVMWGVLFYGQVVVIAAMGFAWGLPALNEHIDYNVDEDDVTNFKGIMYLCLIAGGCGIAVSAVSLTLMTMFPTFLIQFALIFSVAMSLVSGIGAAVMGNVAGAVIGIIFFFIGACYACLVWRRIPFAATNLETALTAVKKNWGLNLVAYFLVLLAFAYSMIWALTFIGVYYRSADCDEGICTGTVNAGYVFLLFLAFFWSQQVIQNTTHVTVAGTVGTWWFDPLEASSCCSKGVGDSFFRATTFSFGSICLGSLLVAIIHSLRVLVQQARSGQDGILLCCVECLLGCIESIMEYFNKWAYIYVGLYGYSYCEAGKNVMTLFEERGWTTIITDDLIYNTLSLMSLVLGILTGALGLLVADVAKDWFTGIKDLGAFAFFISFFVGLVMSSILLGVIGSSVDTVIVCFAEAPAEFQANHPELSEKMRRTWREAYPVASGL